MRSIYHLTFIVLILAAACKGNEGHNTTTRPGSDGLPPDPSSIAPKLDSSIVTNVANSVAFLYSGSNPIQTGVTPGAFEDRRMAVLKGRLLNSSQAPLTGVVVSLLSHPEFGSTLSRADGRFDLVVNAQGAITLDFSKAGFLSAQRQVLSEWNHFHSVDDVVMLPVDGQVTALVAGAPSLQVARASVVADTDGKRQATLLIPAGTTASMTLANGQTQSLTNLHIRATEYTQGDNGPKAMPGTLPPTSGYTYAVEWSVDEAQSVGATSVLFSQPAISYLENFLKFPAGTAVPIGYYDRQSGTWKADDNGRVVTLLGVVGGLAQLDTNGDGIADDVATLAGLSAPVTQDELRQLAQLYPVGASLWRVPLKHFTPWDHNWPYGPPAGAAAPSQPAADNSTPQADPCKQSGSIIECENQVLGEVLPVTGTSYLLHYRSDRTLGHTASNTLKIPLTGATLPPGVQEILLEVQGAGHHWSKSYAPAVNLNDVVVWDGTDAYGRKTQGLQPFTVRIGYTYGAVYQTPSQLEASFAAYSGVIFSNSRARQQITFWQETKTTLGNWEPPSRELGGWSLSSHHAYSIVDGTLYRGDGSRQRSKQLGVSIRTYAGGGATDFRLGPQNGVPARDVKFFDLRAVLAAPDGSVYAADTTAGFIYRISSDGKVDVVAGNGSGTDSGDGGPATKASIGSPDTLAIGPDGSLYFGEYNYFTVRRVAPNGLISTVAGKVFQRGIDGVGGPASQALLGAIEAVAVDSSGTIYIADNPNDGHPRLLRIGADGRLVKIALGSSAFGGDQGPISGMSGHIRALAVDGSGNLYGLTWDQALFKVTADGVVHGLMNSTFSNRYDGNNGPASQAHLNQPTKVTVGKGGTIYILDLGFVRQITTDGIISTIAGTDWTNETDNGPDEGSQALQSNLGGAHDLAVGPDGALYILPGTTFTSKIMRIGSDTHSRINDQFFIPSEDATEAYVFDSTGKHLKTLDALTGTTKLIFGYDASGFLSTVTDANNNVTTIERDGSGHPSAIVSPYRQRTLLSVDGNGYLSHVTNPASETVSLASSADGLLTQLTDAKNQTHTLTYDSLGRLTKDANPAGGFKTLNRIDTPGAIGSFEVDVTTAMGVTSKHAVQMLPGNVRVRNTTSPSGQITTSQDDLSGKRSVQYPDGTLETSQVGADIRYSTGAPFTQAVKTQTPGGLLYQRVQTQALANLPSGPGDLFSFASLTTQSATNGRPPSSSVYTPSTKRMVLTSPMGKTRTVTLDAQARPVQLDIPSMAPVVYGYDSNGRLQSATQAGRSTTLNYNGQGLLKSTVDALNHINALEYDGANRVSRQTFADNQAVQMGYDKNGNVLSITPPSRPVHTFNYTPADLESNYIPPTADEVGSLSTQYGYNLDGNVSGVTYPDGSTVTPAYDLAGRLKSVTQPRGQNLWTYDTSGRVQSLSAPDATLNYSYDGSLVTQVAWSGAVHGTVHYQYDNDFRAAHIDVNGTSATAYAWDADGDLIQAGSLTLSREPANGLLSGTTSSTVSTTLTHNLYGELSNYTASTGSGAVYSYHFTPDNAGRITDKQETILGTSIHYVYGYDAAGRLTDVSQNGTPTAHYGYDANGNRLTGPGSTVGVYDNQDRMLSYAGATFSYGPRGDLQTKTSGGQTTQYRYDVFGNLVQATLPDGTTLEYLVDGVNRRIGKKVNGALVQGFLYSGTLKPIAEVDGNSQVVSQFVYASHVNVPDLMVKGGATYQLVTDALGSPRLVVNTATGAVAQRIDYDEWGNVLADSNPGFQPFGFGGGLYDRDVKLIRFGARDYDPAAGRWTEKDSLRFGGRVPNLYLYSNASPLNSVDPTGHAGFGIMVVANQEGGAFWGAGAQGAAGAGAFLNPQTLTPSLGAFVDAGIFTGGPMSKSSGMCYPSLDTGATQALGVYTGAGLAAFATNANDASGLEGPFDTFSVNVGIGLSFGMQLGISGDTWIFSFSIGPGIGLSVSEYPTNTWSTHQ